MISDQRAYAIILLYEIFSTYIGEKNVIVNFPIGKASR